MGKFPFDASQVSMSKQHFPKDIRAKRFPLQTSRPNTGTELKPYSVFEVVKPMVVQAGKIAPWFDQPGGGIQYILPDMVSELLDPNVGVLRRLR